MADVQLTHKLRNPKSYNDWMNIWTATVHQNPNEYEITPSKNWKISSDILDKIPVDKIESIDFTETVDGEEKNYTTTNVTIKSEPVDETLGLNGNSIAITNADGSISEGAKIDSEGDPTKFLNEKGEWTTEHTYDLSWMINYKLKGDNPSSDTQTFNGYQFYDAKNDTYKRFFLAKSKNINVIPSIRSTYSDATSETLDTIWGFNFELIDKSIDSDKLIDNLDLSDKLADNSVPGSKLDTKLLGAIINTEKPVLELTEDQLKAPENGYYGDSTEWQPYQRQEDKNIILNQSEDNSATWVNIIDLTTKNWNENSQDLGFYLNDTRHSQYSLQSISKNIIYTIRLKVKENDNTYSIWTEVATCILGGIEKYYYYPEYLVPSVETLDEYFSRINSFVETVAPLIKSSFEQYLTTLSNKTFAEIRQIDFQQEMDNIVQSITANYSDNWSELVGIKNPDYSPNQLNNWDYEHCGIWVEI